MQSNNVNKTTTALIMITISIKIMTTLIITMTIRTMIIGHHVFATKYASGSVYAKF